MHHEPVFSQQEQAVVYLFSRYWNKIDVFQGKQICRIHTHFPDFSIRDAQTGCEEAIEFEYGLSDFRSHLGDLGNLNELGIRRLYIVYWEHNDDEKEILRGIRGRRYSNDFTGRVRFVCLKDYFSAGVEAGRDHLVASWLFPRQPHLPKKYPLTKISEATKRLEGQGALQVLKPDKGLYRIIGFNKAGSDFIECDHWQRIHLFTTSTPFGQASIPQKLFVKPNGCKYFSGYFEVDHAFVIGTGSKGVKRYFQRYYFYRYHPDYRESTCFVYSHFRAMGYELGEKLYKYLRKRRYALGVRGSVLVDDPDHLKGIDAICRNAT